MSNEFSEYQIKRVVNVFCLKISKIIDQNYIEIIEILKQKDLYTNSDNKKPIIEFVNSVFFNVKTNLLHELIWLFFANTWPTRNQCIRRIVSFWDKIHDPILHCVETKFAEHKLGMELIETCLNDHYEYLINLIEEHNQKFGLFAYDFNIDFYIEYWTNHPE